MSDTPALGGFDAVTYFEGSGPKQGVEDHATEWRGRRWLFASAENHDRFVAEPERYAPQFDGHCAFAVSLGKDEHGSPERWVVREGRLYLQSNPVAGLLFKLLPGRPEAAHRRWRARRGG